MSLFFKQKDKKTVIFIVLILNVSEQQLETLMNETKTMCVTRHHWAREKMCICILFG